MPIHWNPGIKFWCYSNNAIQHQQANRVVPDPNNYERLTPKPLSTHLWCPDPNLMEVWHAYIKFHSFARVENNDQEYWLTKSIICHAFQSMPRRKNVTQAACWLTVTDFLDWTPLGDKYPRKPEAPCPVSLRKSGILIPNFPVTPRSVMCKASEDCNCWRIAQISTLRPSLMLGLLSVFCISLNSWPTV